MAREWKLMSLREAGVQLIDCEHRTPPAAAAGFPYIAIPQIKDGRLDLSTARLISEDHLGEWNRKADPQENDVILSRRCNPGETAFVPAGLKCTLGQNLVLLRSSGKHIYAPFLRWLVRGDEWWDQIRTFLNVGAVFDSLKCADIPNFSLSIPPIEEQVEIAGALGAIDQKLELNRRMNETLEATARAIFKSWFVDFDPVRAKAEGRPPAGMSADIAALFPAAFQNSELGAIPKGWRTASILQIARLLSGGTPKTEKADYWGGDVLWASAKDVSQSTDTVLVSTERTITHKGLEESSTQLIPAWCTVVVARGATTGRMVLFGREMAMNQTCYALESLTKIPLAVYCQLRSSIDNLVHAAHGSVFDTITTATFENSRITIPTDELLRAFEEAVRPLFHRILSNTNESRTLAKLRDTLLPKLLSGEVRLTRCAKKLRCQSGQDCA